MSSPRIDVRHTARFTLCDDRVHGTTGWPSVAHSGAPPMFSARGDRRLPRSRLYTSLQRGGDLIFRIAAMGERGEEMRYCFAQHPGARPLVARGGVRSDVGAASAIAREPTFFLKFGVRPGHRIGSNAEITRELSYRRQSITRAQLPALDETAQLIHDLLERCGFQIRINREKKFIHKRPSAPSVPGDAYTTPTIPQAPPRRSATQDGRCVAPASRQATRRSQSL